MKEYIRPELNINLFHCANIITLSGESSGENSGYTSGLTAWQNTHEGAQLTKAKVDELVSGIKLVM